MKKLLGLLATAPLAMAACGSLALKTHEIVATDYYLGHGKYIGTEGIDGASNDHFNLIEVTLKKQKNTGEDILLTYDIQESTGYYNKTLTTDQDAYALPNWIEDGSITSATAGYVTADAINTVWPGTVPSGLGYYENTGESLRYVYDTVSIDSTEKDSLVDSDGADVEFIAKTKENYGVEEGFDFITHKNRWEFFLEETYGTCVEVDAISSTEIDELARVKESDPFNTVGGATATESKLYIAAALRTAKTYCDGQ